jgi:CheY-like chemotaxis protein
MVLNARDAMTGGGLVTISATNTDVIGSQGLLLPEGDYVAITITDHGVGIPEQTLLRIFEPYFTTKETCNQKKLGLGLSICYSIIQSHGGHITVRSKPGEGTTFIIYLPVAKSKKTTGQNSVDVPPTGSARVLIMDDEDAVRTIAVEMLQHMGCEVESAGDGTEAIGLFKKALQTGTPFDVVILDLTVAGGMGGEETIKKLVEIDPKVKAIVSSGYSNVRVMSDYSSFGFRGVLAKPFNIFDLGKSVFSLKNAEA